MIAASSSISGRPLVVEQKHNKSPNSSSSMTFSFLPTRINSASKDEQESSNNWKEDDDKALQELRRALREYYNGENIAERSNKLAALKMFGSWDDEDIDPQNWQDADVKAWRTFCSDMSCFDDEKTQNRNRMFEQAEIEIEETKANPPSYTKVWPVAIVSNNFQLPAEEDPTSADKKKKKKKKPTIMTRKDTHVDVVFVEQDQYSCAHGIEVLATPKSKIQDVYAVQSLAKF